jgi:CBS domain-containing protein
MGFQLIKIKDIMIRDVITVAPQESIKKAAEIMNKNEIGCLIVVEDGRPIGIVTERDMLNRALISKKNLEKIEVRDVMTESLVSGKPDMEIISALRMMFKHGIKKLPIIDKSHLVGLVTLTDLAYSQGVLVEMSEIIRKMEHAPPERMVKVINPLFRIITPIEKHTKLEQN